MTGRRSNAAPQARKQVIGSVVNGVLATGASAALSTSEV